MLTRTTFFLAQWFLTNASPLVGATPLVPFRHIPPACSHLVVATGQAAETPRVLHEMERELFRRAYLGEHGLFYLPFMRLAIEQISRTNLPSKTLEAEYFSERLTAFIAEVFDPTGVIQKLHGWEVTPERAAQLTFWTHEFFQFRAKAQERLFFKDLDQAYELSALLRTHPHARATFQRLARALHPLYLSEEPLRPITAQDDEKPAARHLSWKRIFSIDQIWGPIGMVGGIAYSALTQQIDYVMGLGMGTILSGGIGLGVNLLRELAFRPPDEKHVERVDALAAIQVEPRFIPRVVTGSGEGGLLAPPGMETREIAWAQPYVPYASEGPPGQDLTKLRDWVRDRAVYVARFRERVMHSEVRKSSHATLEWLIQKSGETPRSAALQALSQLEEWNMNEARIVREHGTGLLHDWSRVRRLTEELSSGETSDDRELVGHRASIDANLAALDVFIRAFGESQSLLRGLVQMVEQGDALHLGEREIESLRACAEVFAPRK